MISNTKWLQKVFIALLMLLTLFRLFIGFHTPVFPLPNSFHDHQLLAIYANLFDHFSRTQLNYIPEGALLVKPIGYSLFLDFIFLTGISAAGVFTLIWMALSIFFAVTFNKLFHNKFITYFTYLFVLFFPFPLSNLGQAAYRDHFLIILCILITLLLIQIWCALTENSGVKKLLILNISLGLIILWIAITKEGSEYIIILPFVALLFFFVIYRLQGRKYWLNAVSVFLIAPLILVCGVNSYKAINYHFFGVYDIQTRNYGEFGHFLSLVSDSRH